MLPAFGTVLVVLGDVCHGLLQVVHKLHLLLQIGLPDVARAKHT